MKNYKKKWTQRQVLWLIAFEHEEFENILVSNQKEKQFKRWESNLSNLKAETFSTVRKNRSNTGISFPLIFFFFLHNHRRTRTISSDRNQTKQPFHAHLHCDTFLTGRPSKSLYKNRFVIDLISFEFQQSPFFRFALHSWASDFTFSSEYILKIINRISVLLTRCMFLLSLNMIFWKLHNFFFGCRCRKNPILKNKKKRLNFQWIAFHFVNPIASHNTDHYSQEVSWYISICRRREKVPEKNPKHRT